MGFLQKKGRYQKIFLIQNSIKHGVTEQTEKARRANNFLKLFSAMLRERRGSVFYKILKTIKAKMKTPRMVLNDMGFLQKKSRYQKIF